MNLTKHRCCLSGTATWRTSSKRNVVLDSGSLDLRYENITSPTKPEVQRVVNRWNSLDQETVDVGSINSFKGRLDKIRKTRMGFFLDSAWSAKP